MQANIRHEEPGDQDSIASVNRAAFGGHAEARLVNALRESGDVRLSLVAELDGQIVGHILFSRMTIDGVDESTEALALAPMAVLPEYQRKGIGSALVWRGLELCAQAGHRIVLVVGHPEFYPRFGFSREPARRLGSPYQGEAFMALELVPEALRGITGTVRYAPPFTEL